MESGTSDQIVAPNQEDDENSILSNPSIQDSLHRTSSVVSENTYGDDLNIRMESSILVASLEDSEIIEVEDESSPRMEPSLQTTSSMPNLGEDEQSLQTRSTSLLKMEVNPFIGDLLRAKNNKDDVEKLFKELKEKLNDGLQEEVVYAFLEHSNKMEGQKKVQELVYLFEAIEYVKSNYKTLIPKTPYPPIFEAKYHRSDIYYHLLNYALNYATNLQNYPSPSMIHSNSSIVANMFEYFKAMGFMIFLINKVQEEEGITNPSFNPQDVRTLVKKFVDFVHRFEEETISTVICLVVNDEDEEAENLFERLLEHTKPSDIINRGRIYNYALQKVQELLKTRTFLSDPSLSNIYKEVVQCKDRLNGFAIEYDSQVKVHRFLVDLYLRDVDLKQKIDWEFVEQHDYPYLIMYVWEYHKRIIPNDIKHYPWTPVQLNYVFTSSAAIIVGGQDIMKCLLEAWPTLINISYKGVVALHIATLKGNEEVIEFLFKQEGLDINAHTGRLLTTHDVKTFLEYCKPALDATTINKGVMDCTKIPSPYAIKFKDHQEVIKDLLFQKEIEISSKGNLDAMKFIQGSTIPRKKWNKNRWKLSTYQTALHIAVTERHAKVVKLLCDAPKPHEQRLRCHEEDEEDHTPMDILYGRQNEKTDFDKSEIKKILSSKQDVQNGIDRLYRDRQVLVDAVNTILVGSALIAGVTFVGWIQPPLGYVQYYDLAMPYPAPPDTYNSYLAVQGNLGVKAFVLFNSLSFFFAIATVIIGADAAFPTQRNLYIGHVVQTMHLLLRRAIRFLIVSLVCVLGAFGSAAVVVLPPFLFFKKDLVLSIIIGGGVCGCALWQLLSRHSTKVQRLNASIRHIIKSIGRYLERPCKIV